MLKRCLEMGIHVIGNNNNREGDKVKSLERKKTFNEALNNFTLIKRSVNFYHFFRALLPIKHETLCDYRDFKIV
jgi:hypothetical protein